MTKRQIFYKRRRHKEKNELALEDFESSSIGDMAFLLLIFFIVTSSFILRQGIFLSLPSKKASAMKVEGNRLLNVYPSNNGFIIKDTELTRSEFKKKLQTFMEDTKEPILIIRMKDKVKYEHLVDTLSVAKEVGIKKISLKNEGTGKNKDV